MKIKYSILFKTNITRRAKCYERYMIIIFILNTFAILAKNKTIELKSMTNAVFECFLKILPTDQVVFASEQK